MADSYDNDQERDTRNESTGNNNAPHTESSFLIKKKRKQMESRSQHWKGFDRYIRDGQVMAKCHSCQKELRVGAQNGTSCLKNQSMICKRKISSGSCELELVGTTSHGEKVLSSYKFDYDAVRKALVEMIILDELPFKFVMGSGFRHFMETACPRFQIPSRWTIQRDCFERFSHEKDKLKEYFKKFSQRVCITTDTWTTLQRVNYMCVTAHFIDKNWKFHKKGLSFIPIFSHKGKDIGTLLEICLRDWGIEKVFTITVDNASDNEVAVNYVRDKYKAKLMLDGKHIYMRCVAHILNLIIADGMSMHGVFDSIRKVRAVVKYIKNSPARYAIFKKAVSLENIAYKGWLNLDVSTQWNSTYKMLDMALKLRKAFVRYEENDPLIKFDLRNDNENDGMPTIEDWETVKRIVSILKRFYNLTLKVSGSKYVSIHSFFHNIVNLHNILKKWRGSTDFKLSAMAMQMSAKYDKYWGAPGKVNMLLYIAVVFDPRQKLKFLRFTFIDMYGSEKGEELFQNVKSATYDLYNDYKCKFAPPHSQVMASGHVGNSETSKACIVDSDDEDSDEYMTKQRINRFKKAEQGDGKNNKSELDKYLAEDLEDDDSDAFDILAWWKVYSYRLPILGQMAHDILSVPISAVTSESAFSAGERVLDAFRSSLSPRIVESLLCTQDWIRGSSSSLNVEEDIEEIEKLENDFECIGMEAYSKFMDI